MTDLLLHGGGYEAAIAECGAAVRMLRHGDRDLITGWPAEGPIPYYSGALLAPWPNRVGGAGYAFDGDVHRLPVNEPDRGHALHGLIAEARWSVAELFTVEDDHGFARLTLDLAPSQGYPFALSFQVLHRLDGDGLTTTLTVQNVGDRPAPYGCGPHPWLLAGDDVTAYELHLPASLVAMVDEALIPVVLEDVASTPYDFRTPRVIGDTAIDHAFTALAHGDPETGSRGSGSESGRQISGQAGAGGGHDPGRASSAGHGGAGPHRESAAADGGPTDSVDGLVRVRVRGPGGGVEMSWQATELPWVQVCTGTGLGHAGLAVEPMTCPPDAFNSRTDLVVLSPGDKHEASWTIAALQP
ncbi:aldose 1-epimerase family protein [Nonomuraea dietziae]|uniref:aldose 1-epimerase family protein n=1 Tax=Nonomuraea dietziae TaxID=65515 RepID=UPI0033FD2EDF